LLLQVPARAYDGDELFKNSKLANRVPPAHAVLSVADAAAAGVVLGDTVTISSAVGSVTVPVVVDGALPSGRVLLPLVRGLDPAAIITGSVTPVSIVKAE
jgi:anaerobic selenocysteine-containing dehydrogenase